MQLTDSVAVDTHGTLYPKQGLDQLDKKYKGAEFDYSSEVGSSQNLIERFFTWLGTLLRDNFDIHVSPGILTFMKWVIYLAMGGLVLFLIVRLLANENMQTLFVKKAKDVNMTLKEQHIETVNFDKLLQIALKESNYRQAVRYQFLKFLSALSEQHLIDWQYEKTNSDYEQELKNVALREKFKRLVFLYDHIWYGEQTINQMGYHMVVSDFDAATLLIHKKNG